MYEDWVYADEIFVAAPQVTLERVRIARTFVQRCAGLLATKSLAPDEGLMFVPGGSIHTCGMRYPIDVVFLSEHLDVLKVVPGLKPWRFAFAPPRTKFVLELASGASQHAGIRAGELLYAVAKRKQQADVQGVTLVISRAASSRM
jgi:uncharacterized membrane protein (UPF0127 family)